MVSETNEFLQRYGDVKQGSKFDEAYSVVYATENKNIDHDLLGVCQPM